MCSTTRCVGLALSSVVLACMGTFSGCQSTTEKTAGQAISDTSISTAVQTKLKGDRLANFAGVDVNTERGVVNLSGLVETEEQRARAERLAYQVQGVARVNNHLQIKNRPPIGKVPKATPAPDRNAAQPERDRQNAESNLMQSQGVSVIEGNVVHIDGDYYVVKGQDGKEVSLHADTTTMKTQKIKTGDRVEAKFDQNNHALSLLPAR